MEVLTSKNHPLRIDAVAVPGGGNLGMTLCPGKKQAGAISGNWHRDLNADLEVVKAWGAKAVVTLMEPGELDLFQIPDIGDVAEKLDMDWYHLPIRDAHPPGQRFENRWILYGLKLRRILRSGGKVLLHCRGGLGRTGTVAARLLVELGMDPEEATTAVRAARPGTIETFEQKSHVLNSKDPEFDDAFLDRALGCLLGGAVGDAFGYAVEFDSLENIYRRFGRDGIQQPVYVDEKLVVSDDTQMTLFTLEGLARARRGASIERVTKEISRAYADWLDTQGGQPRGFRPFGTLAKRKVLRHRRAPGNTCTSALKNGTDGTPESPINNSKGCGAVMRVAPVGWNFTPDYTQAFDSAAKAGALTHGNPDGWVPAGMLSSVVWILFAGLEPSNALARTKITADCKTSLMGIKADAVAKIAHAEVLAEEHLSQPTTAIAKLGEGWVGDEALAIAVYAVLSASSFEDAIQRAANHDGDSDSTASIAGQIWGAWKGIDALPMSWVRRLDVLAECLHGVRQIAAQGHSATPTGSNAAAPRKTLETPRLLGKYPKNARGWPDEEETIVDLLRVRFGLVDDIHTARLARAVRNQLGYLKGIGVAPVGLMRFGIWADYISSDLEVDELRKHLAAFASIQSELAGAEHEQSAPPDID